MFKAKRYLYIVIVLLALYSLLAFARIVSNSFSSGGIDFYSYWYDGLFIRQGQNNYEALRLGETPTLPLDFVDGVTIKEFPSSGVIGASNTAPMVLLITPLSYFSWEVARPLWGFVSIICIILVPIVLLDILSKQSDGTINLLTRVLVCLIFYSLLPVRNAAGNGQVVNLVFLLMVGAIWFMDRNQIISGVLLGIALSKYSLAFPVFLWFAYKKRFRILITSAAVQLIGLLVFSAITNASPIAVLEEYFLTLKHRVDIGQKGVELASLLPDGFGFTLLSIVLATLPVAYFLWKWSLLPKAYKARSFIIDFHLLTVVSLWIMLAIYHGGYDTVIVIFFVALVIFGLETQWWQLSRREIAWLIVTLAGSIVLMSLPGSVLNPILPNNLMSYWLDFIGVANTLVMIYMLIATLWLLKRSLVPYSVPESSKI